MKLDKALMTVVALGMVAASPLGVARASDSQPLKISSPQAIKGTQTIVIGAFNIGFIFQSIDKTAATGGMIGAFGGATRAKSELVGVTPAMMQSIADAAYLDFKTQLEARGFTVADPATMFSSADFAKVKPIAAPYEAKVQLDKSTGKATYYKPAAIPSLIMLPGDITASGLSGMGLAMSLGTTQVAVNQHAKSSGRAVVDVIYLIDFSNAKRPGAFSFGGIKVTSGMSVVDDYSRMTIVGASGKMATMTLKEAVAVEGDFAEMQDATKDGGIQKAANILGGLAAAGGLGGMRFGKSKTFTFTARPGVYEEGAVKAASLTNTRLADQLAALK